MRIFYTGNDIEDLAASGVRKLEVGAGVTLTDAARERAEELGIALVVAGSAAASNPPASKAAAPAAGTQSGAAKGGSLPARPRGCQHGPLGAGSAASTPVVEQLVDAVSALKKRGG